MELSLEEFLGVVTVLLLSFGQCICACGQAEYDINGECCPMCAPGNRVYKHCTEFTSTTCVPCAESTYTADPNGLLKCLSCTVCDPGQGLRVKIHCTYVSDTVCDPLEGFYCTDQYKDSCRQAVEHTTCSPGQYIKHKGTALKDTVCEGCLDGTYSNGSVDFCQPHLKCEDLGLAVLEQGTSSSDVVCGRNAKVIVIVTVSLAVALGVAVATGLFIWKRKPNAFADKPTHQIIPGDCILSLNPHCVGDTEFGPPTTLLAVTRAAVLSDFQPQWIHVNR